MTNLVFVDHAVARCGSFEDGHVSLSVFIMLGLH